MPALLVAPVSGGLATLLHLVGFGTGAALYALLGIMTRDAARNPGAPGAGSRRHDGIPLATAALGLVWNIGALVHYGVGEAAVTPELPAGVARIVAVLAFTALAMLPAVAVNAAVLGWEPRARRRVAGAAWVLSGSAAVHVAWRAAAGGSVPDRLTFATLSLGYLGLLALLATSFAKARRPDQAAPTDAVTARRGALTLAALAAFSVTGFHLGHHGVGDAALAGRSVWTELLGDHASLPLVLAILYQDYRFALADRFLKRALTALALVSAALATHLLLLAPVAAPRLAADPFDPIGLALQLVSWGAAAALAPRVGRIVSRLVDRVLLGRSDWTTLRPSLVAAMARASHVEAVLDVTVTALAEALAAGSARWTALPEGAAERPRDAREPLVRTGDGARGAMVLVPTAEAPSFMLDFGTLAGGRRLLSDDDALLEWAAMQAGRRIDAIRIAQERYARAAHEEATARLTAQAELRALRAQLNPHLLFNALTTVGYLIQTAPPRAFEALMRLTELLRAVLRSPTGDMVPLGEELGLIEAYLAVERTRFEERLTMLVDVPESLRALPVPPLLLQPLVENAVKHGIARVRRGGVVTVGARRVDGPTGQPALCLWVHDTGAGSDPVSITARQAAGGLGLSSVCARLERLHGDAASVTWETAPDAGMRVTITLPVAAPADMPPASTTAPADEHPVAA